MVKILNTSLLTNVWSDDFREELSEFLSDTIVESERTNIVYKIYYDYFDESLWRLETPDQYDWDLWNDPDIIFVIDMRSQDDFIGSGFDGFDSELDTIDFELSKVYNIDISEIIEEIERSMWE